MSNRTRLSHADLLACLAAHGEAHLDALAAALGYGREKPKSPSEPPPLPPVSTPATPPSEFSRPTISVVAPKAYFYRVVAQRELKPAEAIREMPEWFRDAEPLFQEPRVPGTKSPPRWRPLIPWSRLWPFLKMALGGLWAMQALDVARIVDQLARGQILRYLPRQQHRSWAPRCQLIVDYARPLLPFWNDFNGLHQRLAELRGRQELTVIAFPDGDPGGRCWLYSGQGWQEIDSYLVPVPGTPVLVLSDLGCSDGADVRRRQWRHFGLRLQRADCRPVALMPCPPLWWDRELIGLFYPVCWDRSVRLPQRISAPGWRPAAQRPKPDAGAEQLLALLAPAIRIEPALLRAVRCLLPAREVNVGSEAAAWNHPSVHATPLAFYYDGKAIERYRGEFRKQNAALQRQVTELIAAHHAHLSPAIGYEEQRLAADLKKVPVAAEARLFLERISKTLYYPGSPFASAARDWVQRMSRRQHATMWRDEALAVAWVTAHLPELRAGEKPEFPAGIDLGRVSWLLGQGQTPRRCTLLQRGQALYLEANVQATADTGLDAPGSPLGGISATAPYVQFQRIDQDGAFRDELIQPIDRAIPLPLSGRLQLRTDRQELILGSIERPEWAEDIGRDSYGLYAGFRVQGVYQRLRWIVPGEFMMGSPKTEAERASDETQHRVILNQGYWLADTACTQALWQTVMGGDNPSRFKGEDRPVETVSWYDVQGFLERLNGRVPGGGFRLPTEAEWEYACRAGTTTPFWFGDQITPEQVNYDGNNPYAGGQKGKYRQETVDVQALPCNNWGLYQMHGNVWEWCQDWYGEYPSSAVENPTGPAKGEGRVLRGGGWIGGGGSARSAFRLHYDPGFRFGNFGFRLARGQASSRRAPAAGAGDEASGAGQTPGSGGGQAPRASQGVRKKRKKKS